MCGRTRRDRWEPKREEGGSLSVDLHRTGPASPGEVSALKAGDGRRADKAVRRIRSSPTTPPAGASQRMKKPQKLFRDKAAAAFCSVPSLGWAPGMTLKFAHVHL